jgi:hypothetical protein
MIGSDTVNVLDVAAQVSHPKPNMLIGSDSSTT